jgi:hypothetical protein
MDVGDALRARKRIRKGFSCCEAKVHAREAFDAVCKHLDDTGQPALVREIIAKRIIEAARTGERDPVRLRDAGLAALGYDREAI